MASSIVKSASQQMGNLIVEEAKYLYNVRGKIESLQKELEWMEEFFKGADTLQHKDRVSRIWVSDVYDLAYDVEDIIEKYRHGVPRHRQDGIRNTLKWFSCILFTCDASKLHKLGSEIDELAIKMIGLKSRLETYGQRGGSIRSLEYNINWEDPRKTYSHTEEDAVGLDKAIQKVVGELLKTQVKVVAISGVGGLGKTTLARKVFNHPVIKAHFNGKCAWVYVSKEFFSKNIFQEILRQLGKGNDANRSLEQSVEETHKVLQEKRCLVVVDDIWTVEAWERLEKAFVSICTAASSSSKIVITTRNRGLLERVDRSGYHHLLQPLSDGDSWKLLKQKAFIGHGNTDDEHMERLAKAMLKHCDGIPLAIIAIGGILSTRKTLSEWEDVGKNISSYLTSNGELESTDNRLMEILELSYNDLPFCLKTCFLYLGHFPEDYEISTHKLYHMWEAEGFLEGEAQKKGVTSYGIGERYLNKLVQRSMVLVRKRWANGGIKITCQVHDVIRDMCLAKCKKMGFLSHIACTESGMVRWLPPFSIESNKVRRCALMDEDEVDGEWHLRKKADEDEVDGEWHLRKKVAGLRSLLVFKKFSLGSEIWKSCLLLRVLDLQKGDFKSLDGMKCLIHLRYLSLRGSEVEKIPSFLFDLQYVETLDLRCNKKYYPCAYMLSNKFYKMKRLKHLYLPRNYEVEAGEKLRFPSDGQMETIKNFDPSKCEAKMLMQMTNLRVFSITKYYICGTAEELKWVLESPVIKKAGQLINTFPRVSRIKEDLPKEDRLILSSFDCHSYRLTICGTGGKHMKKKSDSIIFPNNVKRVELRNCDTSVEGGLLLDLRKLPYLEVLHLEDSTIGEATNKLSFSPHSFPLLREFNVLRPNRSFEWEVGKEAAPNLRFLVLENCKNLNKLKNIPNSLYRVTLLDCAIKEGVSALEKLPRLRYLFVKGALVNIKSLSFSEGSFPQLFELELKDQPELEKWEVGEGALANLRNLELEGLKKVVMNKLPIPDSLERVVLEDCDIFCEGGDVSLFGCLEKLPQLQHLRSAAGGGGNKLSFSPGGFPRLHTLNLRWHPEWMEWEVGDGALPNLQMLSLSQCKKLNKLNNLPNSLTRVHLNWCGNGDVLISALENLPCLEQLEIYSSTIGGNKMSFSAGSFPQLTQLTIKFPRRFKEWEVGDGALPTLQRLELKCCTKLKKLPEGLPDSVDIECEDPCIKGIEKYNTCPHFKNKQKTKAMGWLRNSCP